LENRTRDSKREMESIEKLEELRDLNTRVAASMFVLNQTPHNSNL